MRRSRRALLAGASGAVAAGVMVPFGTMAQGATPVMPGATPVAGGGIAFSAVASLSHSNSPDTPVWPRNPLFAMETLSTVEADGFYTNLLTYHEHTGTHMDSPSRFIADGITADLIDSASLVAPLVVVDVTDAAADDEDYGLAVHDLETHARGWLDGLRALIWCRE